MADIPLDFLKNIRRIELRTNRLVEDLFAGKYRSIFRGKGMDFEEVREYMPGDEIRYIDWNVSARMNAPYIKVFREERELTMMLAVDISASSGMGSETKSKRERMAEMAATLAFSATRNNDRVGLMLFTDEIECVIPPGKGRRHILRIIRQILYFKPEGRGTNCKKALEYLGHILHRNAMIFFLSDFFDEGFERAMRITIQRYDLVPIITVDERELSLPDIGRIALEDAETGEIVEVNTSRPEVRAAFAEAAELRMETLRRLFRSMGADFIELREEHSNFHALQQFFKTRIKRR